MHAKLVIKMVYDQCRYVWPTDWKGMAKHQMDLMVAAGVFALKDSGTHKYIPTERLNTELGLPQGAGVYGYHKFDDGSYVLMTCSDGLASWAGGDEKPEFNDYLPIDWAKKEA